LFLSGILARIPSLITNRVPCNHQWAQISGWTLESVAIGNRYRVKSPLGNLNLNLFATYVADSGLGYKTSALRIVRETIERMQETLKDKYQKEVKLLMPQYITVEGLIEYLANKEGKYSTEGIIIKDEFTTLFKDIAGKRYLSDELEIYSQSYDGSPIKRMTRSEKLEFAENYIVSMVSATTPQLYQIMGPEFFYQGLGNRIIWCTGENNQIYIPNPSRWEENWQKTQDEDREIEEIAEELCKIRMEGIADRYMYLTGKSAELTEDFDQANKALIRDIAKLKKPNEYRHLYVARQTERMLKLAGLYHIAYAYKSRNFEVLTENDIKWAIEKAKIILNDYDRMIEEWKGTELTQPIKTEINYNQRVLDFVTARGGIVTQTDLARKFQGWGDKLGKVLSILVQAGELNVEHKLVAGPTKTIYRLKGVVVP
jgi:hypothetical protein